MLRPYFEPLPILSQHIETLSLTSVETSYQVKTQFQTLFETFCDMPRPYFEPLPLLSEHIDTLSLTSVETSLQVETQFQTPFEALATCRGFVLNLSQYFLTILRPSL